MTRQDVLWRLPVLLICASVTKAPAANFTSEKHLREHMVSDYDRMMPPGQNHNTTNVLISFWLESFMGVDQAAGTFTIDVYFRLHWHDPRLAFDALDTIFAKNQLNILDIKDRIWTPDMFFMNAVKSYSSPTPECDEFLTLEPDGEIRWSRKFVLDLRCSMNFRKFPFDKQRCSIDVMLYGTKADDALLDFPERTSDGGFSTIEHNQFQDFTASFSTGINEYSVGTYSYASVSFEFTRIKGIWLNVGIVFTNIFVLISYCGYWIDPAAAPARVALAVICVLVVISNLMGILRNIPAVSYSVWMTEYCVGCLFFNLVAVLTYAVVNFGMHHLARLKADFAKRSMELGEEATAERTPSWHERQLAKLAKLDWHMRWIFPLAFITFNIYMFASIGSFGD